MLTDKFTHVNECFFAEAFFDDHELLCDLEGVHGFLIERTDDINMYGSMGDDGFEYAVYFHPYFHGDPVVEISSHFKEQVEKDHAMVIRAAKACGDDWQAFKRTLLTLGCENITFASPEEFEDYAEEKGIER